MCTFCPEIPQPQNLFDIFFKAATITIAGINLVFAFIIFRVNLLKSKKDKESERKLALFRVLVLDSSIKYFYEIFDKIEFELKKLNVIGLNDDQKEQINSVIADLLIQLRRKFYDALLAIDVPLYDAIKTKADKFQDDISNAIFDAGINLSHTPKYEEEITERVTSVRTDIIRILFEYKA